MTTTFPHVSPLSLRDQMDQLLNAATSLAATMADAHKMATSKFARSWKFAVRTNRIILVEGIDKLMLSANLLNRGVEVMLEISLAFRAADTGYGTVAELVEAAKRIA